MKDPCAAQSLRVAPRLRALSRCFLMDDLNLDEPNDDYWYAFGRIAEQYGERDIAIADYRKLQKPKEPHEIPTSTYRLAQMRLKAMGVSGSPAVASK